jgi:hypothetical protein
MAPLYIIQPHLKLLHALISSLFNLISRNSYRTGSEQLKWPFFDNAKGQGWPTQLGRAQHERQPSDPPQP